MIRLILFIICFAGVAQASVQVIEQNNNAADKYNEAREIIVEAAQKKQTEESRAMQEGAQGGAQEGAQPKMPQNKGQDKPTVPAEAARKLQEAETLLNGILVKDPFNPELHMNLGLVFELQQKHEKAFKQYESVLRLPKLQDEMKFKAHFNAGNAAAAAQKIDQALQHYQAALVLAPESLPVKNNIELLFMGGGQGQGGGGGQGENQDPQSGGGQNQSDQPDQQKEKPKFDSQNLTQDDVKKIIEELKSQEKKIRALEYGNEKQGKEAQPDKDW